MNIEEKRRELVLKASKGEYDNYNVFILEGFNLGVQMARQEFIENMENWKNENRLVKRMLSNPRWIKFKKSLEGES